MTKYMVSFDQGAMTFPEEDFSDVAAAAHAVVREMESAGVWVFGGGLLNSDETTVVAIDGTVSDAPPHGKKTFLGGFSIIDVASRDEGLQWAAKMALACRCAQEVREIMADPELD